MRPILFLCLLFSLTGAAAADTLVTGQKVAFVGLGFTDYSTEGAYDGERADQTARLQLIEDFVAERFRSEGAVLVDLAPVAEKLGNISNPGDCSGCDVRFARTLGARYALSGRVSKVSNLILTMELVLRETDTGDPVRARIVSIRSNTDQSWQRGMNYILKTAFFPQ